jgi:hypothetical protein
VYCLIGRVAVTVAVFVQPLAHRSHRRTFRNNVETLAPYGVARKARTKHHGDAVHGRRKSRPQGNLQTQSASQILAPVRQTVKRKVEMLHEVYYNRELYGRTVSLAHN